MTLNLGEDIPVPTTAFTAIAAGGASVNPLTSFTYRAVGVIVEMTPRVTYENESILDLVLENSTLGANIDVAGTSLPTFGSRRVVTRLRLRDGESNLLAGLIREEDRNTLRGVAGTLRVPLLKSLLGDNDRGTRKTEIVMLLTPRIVRTHELTQRDVSPTHIGTQTRLALSGPPPVIASQPDAGASPLPPTGQPDAGAPSLPPTGQPDVGKPIGAAAPVAEAPAVSGDGPGPSDPVPSADIDPDVPDVPEGAEALNSAGPTARAEPLPAARVLVPPPPRCAVPGRRRTLHRTGFYQWRLATVHGLAHGNVRPECPARPYRPGGWFHASGRSPGNLHAASRCRDRTHPIYLDAR